MFRTVYTLKIVLYVVLLHENFCICDENSASSSSSPSPSRQKPSQNNLGPQFADEYEKNAVEVAQGIGTALGLSPEQTQIIQEFLVFLARIIAYIVGASAQGKSHVPVNSNSSQADKNGKIASVIGQRIGQELTDTPILNLLLNDKQKQAIAKSNSKFATYIARFFGTLGDIGIALKNHKPQGISKAVSKYPDANNDN